MKETRIRVTVCLVITVLVAFTSVVCAADDQVELQRRLFERYDRKDVVSIAPGVVLGRDISEGLQPNFAVEYTHLHESVAIPQSHYPQEQLDRRTFARADMRAGEFDRLTAPERLYVSEFYVVGDSVVFYLISPSITRFGYSATSGEKKFYGVKFTFVFPANVMQSGDYDAVVREIDNYLVLVSEYQTALQRLEQRKRAPRVEIQPGMSEEEVVKALGQAERTIVFGKKTVLTYADVSIELEDNRAVDIKFR